MLDVLRQIVEQVVRLSDFSDKKPHDCERCQPVCPGQSEHDDTPKVSFLLVVVSQMDERPIYSDGYGVKDHKMQYQSIFFDKLDQSSSFGFIMVIFF